MEVPLIFNMIQNMPLIHNMLHATSLPCPNNITIGGQLRFFNLTVCLYAPTLPLHHILLPHITYNLLHREELWRTQL